jgi:hypothetical protein
MTCQHKACKPHDAPILKAELWNPADRGISPDGWYHAYGKDYCHWATPDQVKLKSIKD